jgi:serine/threonine protein kinase
MKTNTPFYPFQETCFDPVSKTKLSPDKIRGKNGHAYSPAGNTFGAGLMVYQMMTMDEPEVASDFLDRIMAEKEPIFDLDSSLLSTDNLEQRVDSLEALGTPSEAIHYLGLEEYHARASVFELLQNWQCANYSDELKNLVEGCLFFKPEDRFTADNLLKGVEFYMHRFIEKELTPMTTEFSAATKIYATEADLNDMQMGNHDFDKDAEFWDRLAGAYKWLNVEEGIIRPKFNKEVTEKALVMFYPGYKEAKNEKLLGRLNVQITGEMLDVDGGIGYAGPEDDDDDNPPVGYHV